MEALINLLDVSNPKRLKDTFNKVLEDTAASNALVEELANTANANATNALIIAEEANLKADNAVDTSQNALNVSTETADKTNQLESKLNSLNIEMTYDAATGTLGLLLKDSEDNILSESSKDLPLELLISSGAYNPNTQEIMLTLANGDVLTIDVKDLIDIYQADEETLTLENNIFKIKLNIIQTIENKLDKVKEETVTGGVARIEVNTEVNTSSTSNRFYVSSTQEFGSGGIGSQNDSFDFEVNNSGVYYRHGMLAEMQKLASINDLNEAIGDIETLLTALNTGTGV